MKKTKKTSKLTAAIIICFLLMGSPLVILVDRSGVSIMNVPLIYIFVFALYIILCILTFIGYKTKWGDDR